MAHLIKLFNCSGNHYHHHRCSIIHHFWRALLTSRVHSSALLKRGQISPTPLGVSAVCNLSLVSVARKLTVKQGKWKGGQKKRALPPALLPALSLSLCLTRTHSTLFSLINLPHPTLPPRESRIDAARGRHSTLHFPEWVQSWGGMRLWENNSPLSTLWARDSEGES